MIYINKIQNRITFKTKTEYYLEILTPETMKVLGSTKIKKTQDKNGETLPHLEITEVVLTHHYVVNNHYQRDSRVLYFKKILIQNFQILKYCLLIKILNLKCYIN